MGPQSSSSDKSTGQSKLWMEFLQWTDSWSKSYFCSSCTKSITLHRYTDHLVRGREEGVHVATCVLLAYSYACGEIIFMISARRMYGWMILALVWQGAKQVKVQVLCVIIMPFAHIATASTECQAFYILAHNFRPCYLYSNKDWSLVFAKINALLINPI